MAGFYEWNDTDEQAKEEAEAIQFAFHSVTRCGKRYRKPRGKNGFTPARAKKEATSLSQELEASLKRDREARVKKMIARILASGDE